ncbi:uncharacterized protein UTRI_00342_B [Ustilago trichophora]|uniref:CTLH domain-containing protein n=1 Tax=Ustilago trichophora TaxID=86804 RepID=A0A5C3DS07_9BASI|nr:uncharacterized protein UTRI_00342_B [Ustilago trichophora]
MQSSMNDRGNPSQPSSDDADLTSPANLRKLVLNYLLHHCYTDTAIAFAKDGIIGDLYGAESSALPSSSSDSAGLTSNNARGATSSATASSSRGAPSSSAAASSTDVAMRTSNGGGRQAHPLSAPPLSRDDSSMEIEVENLLPTTSEQPDASTAHSNGYSNGAPHRSLRSRSGAVGHDEEQDDEDLEDAELASEYDEVEEDLDVDISPDLTAEDVKGVLARKQIKEYIISGHIRQAMDMINEHFPTVLNNTSNGSSSNGTKSSRTKASSSSSSSTSAEKVLPANPTSMEPDHLLLNLQIQMFIEAIRSASSAQLAPPSSASLSASGGLPSLASTTPGIAASISRAASPAPSTSSSNGSATSATGTNAALNPALHSALSYAQGLYASAQKLPSFWRAMYLKELEQVTALLAYTDVERSPVRRFLTRSRKVALAEQVNSAILIRSGKPSQPLIEVAVRQTTLMCYHAATDEISVPVGHPMWGLVGGGAGAGGYDEASNGGKKSREGRKVPLWKFRSFLQER